MPCSRPKGGEIFWGQKSTAIPVLPARSKSIPVLPIPALPERAQDTMDPDRIDQAILSWSAYEMFSNPTVVTHLTRSRTHT